MLQFNVLRCGAFVSEISSTSFCRTIDKRIAATSRVMEQRKILRSHGDGFSQDENGRALGQINLRVGAKELAGALISSLAIACRPERVFHTLDNWIKHVSLIDGIDHGEAVD
jgi:hypothetical protein